MVMATPEGRVKSKIKQLLDPRKPNIYYDMPVPSGYGKSTLDFIGWYYGEAFAIEAKREKKTPTDRQEGTREDMEKAGAKVFVIAGEAPEQFLDLIVWLQVVYLRHKNDG
jgi:hypothetical protein